VFLTAAGENLFQFSRKMILDAEQLEHALHLIEDTEVGSVMIATKEPYAISHWPRYLKYLEGVLPNLEVTMRISRINDEILKLLEEEKIDLAMVPDPAVKEGIIAYELFVDRFHLYASPELALRLRRERDWAVPIYLFKRALCGNGKTVEKVLKEKKLKLRNLKDIDSFNVARSFALKGLGVGLIVDSLVEEDVRAGRLQQVAIPSLDPAVFGSLRACLCMLEKYSRSKRLKKIRHALREFHTEKKHE
jgi:DNA-binding transcriptional LysR family regulator